MYPRISFVALVLAVMVFMVSAHLKKKLCDCLLKKCNACAGKQFVVKAPKQLKFHPHAPKVVCHTIPGPVKFKPIDGICNCAKGFVKSSAGVAKPGCALCDKESKLTLSPPNIFYPPPDKEVYKPTLDLQVVFPPEAPVHHSVHSGSYLDAHLTGHVGSYHLAKSLPADPVSLSIAYRNAQKRHIKEDAIAFGPISIPKDGTVIKPVLNIPEEGLLSFDKQVVELKNLGKLGHATVEEEAHEALRLAHEKNHLLELDLEVKAPAHLTYADVGYLPEKPKPGPHFVVAPPVPAPKVPPPKLPPPKVPIPEVAAVITAELIPAVHSYQASHASYAHSQTAHTEYSSNYVTDHSATAHSAPPVSAPVDAADEYYDYAGNDYAYDNQVHAAPAPPAYDHHAPPPAPVYNHQAYAPPPKPAPLPPPTYTDSSKEGFVSRLALAAADYDYAYDNQVHAAPPAPVYNHQAYPPPPKPAPLPSPPYTDSSKESFVSKLALAAADYDYAYDNQVHAAPPAPVYNHQAYPPPPKPAPLPSPSYTDSSKEGFATKLALAAADYDYAYDNQVHAAPPAPVYNHQAYPPPPKPAPLPSPPYTDSSKEGFVSKLALAAADYDYAYDNQLHAPPPTPAPLPAKPCKDSDEEGFVSRVALAAADYDYAYDNQVHAAPPTPTCDHQAYAPPPTPAPRPAKPGKDSDEGGFVSRLALATAHYDYEGNDYAYAEPPPPEPLPKKPCKSCKRKKRGTHQ